MKGSWKVTVKDFYTSETFEDYNDDELMEEISQAVQQLSTWNKAIGKILQKNTMPKDLTL